MSLQTISTFSLMNEGGFIAKMRFNYIDNEGLTKTTLQTGDINPGRSMAAKLADFGVPDGAVVYLQVDVVWGRSHKANEAYVHDEESDGIARYAIAGTTASPMLRPTGVAGDMAGAGNSGGFQ